MRITLINGSNMISEMIKRSLAPYGYDIEKLEFVENSKNYFIPDNPISILSDDIVDIELKELIKMILKTRPDTKIICLVRKSPWDEKKELYDRGAEDVIEIPFRTEELVTRIKRFSQVDNSTKRKIKRYKIGLNRLDLDKRDLKSGENRVDLRRKEFGILEYLAKNRERVVSRSELMDHLWDYRRINSSNTVDVHVSKIRKKLKDKKIIRTVHGFGYKIDDRCEPDTD